jgi:hypothetical protein
LLAELPGRAVRIANSDDPTIPEFLPRFANTSSGRRSAPTCSTIINHALDKAYVPDEHRQAKYSEPSQPRNMTIADIEIFSMQRSRLQSNQAPEVALTV